MRDPAPDAGLPRVARADAEQGLIPLAAVAALDVPPLAARDAMLGALVVDSERAHSSPPGRFGSVFSASSNSGAISVAYSSTGAT